MTAAPPQMLLAHHLKALKLPTFLREYEKVAGECAREGVDHPGYLLRLVELELIDRERRLVERRIREARFPAVKSLDTFDFTAMPTLNKPLVLELARCEFVVARDNIIVLGNSGTGRLCCTDGQCRCTEPRPCRGHTMRTYSGRPSSSMRFSTLTAMATSLACRPSVCERSLSPITRFQREMSASTRARQL